MNRAGLEHCKKLLVDYKEGRIPEMTPELWRAKKVVDSTLHPGQFVVSCCPDFGFCLGDDMLTDCCSVTFVMQTLASPSFFRFACPLLFSLTLSSPPGCCSQDLVYVSSLFFSFFFCSSCLSFSFFFYNYPILSFLVPPRLTLTDHGHRRLASSKPVPQRGHQLGQR